MAAAAHSDKQIVIAGKPYCLDHIGHTGAARNQGRAFVMHPVPDLPHLIIVSLLWCDDTAAQAGLKCLLLVEWPSINLLPKMLLKKILLALPTAIRIRLDQGYALPSLKIRNY
jgi:hypothetical protein